MMMKHKTKTIPPANRFIRSISDLLIEFLALQHQEMISRSQDAALGCYGSGRVHVVSRDHSHGDAGSLAFSYSLWHLETI